MQIEYQGIHIRILEYVFTSVNIYTVLFCKDYNAGMDSLPFLKGVNLGGWLVTERWMTPSLYEGSDAIDEYSFLQNPQNVSRLRVHHENFIIAEDFQWLSDHGINAVRIPVGYWVFEGDPPFISSIEYLDWAIRRAEKYHLLVLIDLHAAPGSQNGKDHSGKSGRIRWYTNVNQQKTIEVLQRLVKRYKNYNHVFGIELINEPKSDLLGHKLRKFYKTAYAAIIKVAHPRLHVVFHDAFRPHVFTGCIKNGNENHPVLLDNHHYGFFDDRTAKKLSVESYFAQLEMRSKLYENLSKDQKVIIGEWSLVMSENILETRKNEALELMIKNGKIQKRIYEQTTAGWFYWSYKTESRGIWNFRSLVEDGLLQV